MTEANREFLAEALLVVVAVGILSLLLAVAGAVAEWWAGRK